MTAKKTAALFPSAGCKYSGNELNILNGMSGDLRELTARAEAAAPFDRKEFENRIRGDFTDPIQSQYAAYIISCALSNLLKRSRVHIDSAAAYNTGLYAALFHAESITFEQGLDLITKVHGIMVKAAAGLDFAAGVIAGLDEQDMRELAEGVDEIEILNVNNSHQFIIGGPGRAVAGALACAKERGAIHAGHAARALPCHSRLMEPAAREIRDLCSGMRIYDPGCRIISAIDATELTTWEGVAGELSRAVRCGGNWRGAMEHMIASGTDACIECGPGRSLYRIARGIDGAFTVYHINTLRALLVSDRACNPPDSGSFRCE